MKVLVVHPGPNFSVADVYTGWCEALRDLGCQVARYNLDERLTFYGEALRELDKQPGTFVQMLPEAADVQRLAVDGVYSMMFRFRPDVLLVVSAMFVPPELLDSARAAGIRVVLLHTESPYEDDRQLMMSAHADVTLLNDPVNIGRFAELGPAWYVPHAYRPHVHYPGADAPAADFTFVGTGFPSRIEFFEAMDLAGLDVTLGGNWKALAEDSPLHAHIGHDLEECVDNARTAELYRSARVGLNLYRREANAQELVAGWAMGPREVEMAACGLPFLRDARGEGDAVLSMLPTFGSPEEAGELLRYYLAHDDLRQESARLAREAVADRTFTNHAAALLRRIS